MPNTPNRGYPYPDYTNVADFPAQYQAFITALDADLDVIRDAAEAALDEPSVRVAFLGVTVVPQNVNTTVTYNLEEYDNDNMFNIGVSTSNVTINTTGIYLVSGSLTMASDGAAGGAVALIPNVGVNPFGVSRALDNDKETSLSYTTLINATVVPQVVNQTVRHNHGAALNLTNAQFTLTRIA